ncbi:P-loop containing nucleoside triphosphate hydrolase protein [Schizophyllum amplum]|uniref:P-loop containing nucleoside triphosphate hydrolase protein n=1 Tax=Schizophyllum amplum TaxID=97359 RepID=A0A550CUI8_9AGAR|nr:P-loop containing nucleoside triphosphate hydrolase protein [Auriculariopsis ampla]
MEQYARMDPYSRSRYDQGIDSKIVIMGNSGVGKTSLLRRYTQNKFDPKNTTSTSGAFFVTKKVTLHGLKVRLQLWDTAGQERFRSMAPMYYRGANAALLLYDITDASTFSDIRGWLEELHKNCSPELIIYIVGAKADLQHCRQVTSDLARLSLHNWFPPPRPPSPPPPPPPSTLSYIRPRFTSFPGLRSPPPSPAPLPSESPPRMEIPVSQSSALQPSALQRRNTAAVQQRSRPRFHSTAGLNRSKTVDAGLLPQTTSRFGSHFGNAAGGWKELDSGSASIKEDEGNIVVEERDEPEWGLTEGMQLFEVSAKDDVGIEQLFESLIGAIVRKKDMIERENELKKRDSVCLSSAAPAWSAQADAEEAREKTARSSGGWSCC